MWNKHGAFLANDNQYGDVGGERQILALSQIVINPSIIKMSSCGFIIYIHTTQSIYLMGTLLIDAHNSIMGIPLQTENRFSVILLTVLPKESHVMLQGEMQMVDNLIQYKNKFSIICQPTENEEHFNFTTRPHMAVHRHDNQFNLLNNNC